MTANLRVCRTCYPWLEIPPREPPTTTLRTSLTSACSRPFLSSPSLSSPSLPLPPQLTVEESWSYLHHVHLPFVWCGPMCSTVNVCVHTFRSSTRTKAPSAQDAEHPHTSSRNEESCRQTDATSVDVHQQFVCPRARYKCSESIAVTTSQQCNRGAQRLFESYLTKLFSSHLKRTMQTMLNEVQF